MLTLFLSLKFSCNMNRNKSFMKLSYSRCSACDVGLSTWYFEKDGLLFCKDDYGAAYGEACQGCGQIITGPVMLAGDHKFHPECFACNSCGAFIGDGESYALVERSKLYCGSCYKRQMQPINRTANCPFSRKPHSIRLVEIPPNSSDPEKQRGIKLTLDTTPNPRNCGALLRISEYVQEYKFVFIQWLEAKNKIRGYKIMSTIFYIVLKQTCKTRDDRKHSFLK